MSAGLRPARFGSSIRSTERGPLCRAASDWTIAIALVENGAPTLAAVVNPVRGEAFEARAGAGAFLNGWRIHASERSELEGAELVVPEPLLDNKRWATPWPQPAPLGFIPCSTGWRSSLPARRTPALR